MRKSQEDLLGTSIEGYLAIARSDLASEVENRQLRRLSFQLSEILSLSSRSISRSSSRSIPVTMQVTIPSGRSSLEVVVEVSFQLSKLLSLSRRSSLKVVEKI